MWRIRKHIMERYDSGWQMFSSHSCAHTTCSQRKHVWLSAPDTGGFSSFRQEFCLLTAKVITHSLSEFLGSQQSGWFDIRSLGLNAVEPGNFAWQPAGFDLLTRARRHYPKRAPGTACLAWPPVHIATPGNRWSPGLPGVLRQSAGACSHLLAKASYNRRTLWDQGYAISRHSSSDL
jgi:hypothetical protein